MSELFLDRIEGELAVITVDGREVKLPRALLPADAREGDVLKLARDEAATKAAHARVGKLRGKLGDGDDGGDLKL